MRQNLQALVKAGSKQPSTKQENTQSKPKTVYNGYFNDEQIKNRSLKDWQGTWQSVYPLVAKGELDQVFHYKAKLNPKKTAEDYVLIMKKVIVRMSNKSRFKAILSPSRLMMAVNKAVTIAMWGIKS